MAAYAFFLFAAALGAAIRYHAYARIRDIDQAKAREREQLARELHDTVAHHVSGIAIQAQAGRAVARRTPSRPLEALAVIEDEASRTLTEMRTMVGVLRAGRGSRPRTAARASPTSSGSPPAPANGHASTSSSPATSTISRPSVEAAIYRLAQESITNAVRHARHATRVRSRVAASADCVRLTVDDDGDAGTVGPQTPSGYGLVGMTERAKLLGGTLEAGPDREPGLDRRRPCCPERALAR